MGDGISRKETAEGVQNPLAWLVTNFSPPMEGKPSLLSHDEVITLFHEFGHGLHHMLTRVAYPSVAGINGVPWDAVELPSQFMENWCWERSGLDLFAAHHETGERIPDALYDKMLRARTYRAANAQMRQLGFATTDLALHRDYDQERDGDVMAYARASLQKFSPTDLPESYAMLAGFTHIFAHPTGYAAGYYSYKWAEVLSADAWSAFEENGVFDAAHDMSSQASATPDFSVVAAPTSELVRGPTWGLVRLSADGESLDLDSAELVSQRRALDMARGVLVREWTLRTSVGRTRLRSLRRVPRMNRCRA